VPRSVPRFLTVEWLGGTIRICTYGGRSSMKMAWVPWNDSWSAKKKRETDLMLVERIKP
jgi:hypothetical protein